MSNTLNILHLKSRIDRYESFTMELSIQGISDFKVWDGMVIPNLPFMGISLSHRRIVQDAKDRGLERVIIAEDDIYFSAPKAWDYYLLNMPKLFDMYFGVVYDSEIENNRIVSGLAGLTLYTVHNRFYDTFLGLKSMNNLDRELGNICYKHEYMVCPEFVSHQRDGFSDHKKQNATYGHLIKGRKMFGID